jgi:hypothetical protein
VEDWEAVAAVSVGGRGVSCVWGVEVVGGGFFLLIEL